jgi:hypothetical protein
MVLKRWLWLALFVALGGLAAWLAMPAPHVDAAPLAAATLNGKPLPLDAEERCLAAARDAARQWLEQPVAIVVEGTPVSKTREQLGARVDAAHVQALVAQLFDDHSALRRTHAREHGSAPLALDVPHAVDTTAALGTRRPAPRRSPRAPRTSSRAASSRAPPLTGARGDAHCPASAWRGCPRFVTRRERRAPAER